MGTPHRTLSSITPQQFLEWLALRRERHSLASIGESLGVSHQAVRGWLSGQINPSRTVLLLAERIMADPHDVGSGLPQWPGR